MRHLSPLNLIFWCTGIFLLGFIAYRLVRRGLVREFPIFSSYIFFHLIHAALGLYVVRTHSSLYFGYFGLVGDAIDVPLSLALIYEIFTKSLQPYGALRRSASILYIAGTVILIVLASWAALMEPHLDPGEINSVLLSISRSVEMIRIGLLIALFAFHRVLGLTWRHYVVGIALGLGISASLTGAALAARLQLGGTWYPVFNLIAQSSYDVGLLIWSYYLATEESTVKSEVVLETSYLARWNDALEELLAR